MIEFREAGPNSIIIDKNMIKLSNRNQIYLDDGNVWILEMYEGKNDYKANGEDLFSVFDGFSVLEDAVSVGIRLSDRTYQSMRDLQLGHGLDLPLTKLSGMEDAETCRKRGVADLKAYIRLRLETEIAPLGVDDYLALIPDSFYEAMWFDHSGGHGFNIDACAADLMEDIVKNIIYGLYKKGWMANRGLTVADEEQIRNEYIQECYEDGETPPDWGADKYLMEQGFNGEIYACFSEFLNSEYLDEDCMRYVQCKLSDKQHESDRLRGIIMEKTMEDAGFCYESSAEMNRAWCAQCEEHLLQDIVTVEMDKLDRIGNKRVFPGPCPSDFGEQTRLARAYILETMQHAAFARGEAAITPADSGDVFQQISELKRLHPFHLRLPAIQSIERGRYCTSVGKAKVFNRSLIEHTGKTPVKVLVVSGERREESKNRAGYNEIELHPTNATKRGNRVVHWWRPVIDHTEQEIWDRLRFHRCVPHPVYACGWNRCSCMMCIFSKREQWAGIRELFPDEYRRIVDDERILGFNMHIGMPLDEYVGDAQSCVYRGDKKALHQLISGQFTKEDIFCTGAWQYPAGAFGGAEGGPC